MQSRRISSKIGAVDFGMPTLIELSDVESAALFAHTCGLDFVELNMNLPYLQVDTWNIAELQKISRKYGVYYTIHLDENLDPCDFNPYIGDGYIRTIEDVIRAAKELDVHILNMHLSRGVHFTLPDRKVYLYAEHVDRYMKRMRLFKSVCEDAIGSADIEICVENTDGYTPFQLGALDTLLESERFALTFDIGHNHSIGGGDEAVILARNAKLKHFHFHDAVGKKNHLALGDGEIDIGKYLEIANGNQARVVLETKTVDGILRSIDCLNALVD
ncbi:MAG: sugar phosphate isomerase/epimerase [Clostridiales bacterium]|nr:sugar phosphate isomerase/epimerase [Clostridiales bacterium]